MSNTDLDPILWVNTLSREGMMVGAGLCHLEREGLRYLVPVGHEGGSIHQQHDSDRGGVRKKTETNDLMMVDSQSFVCVLVSRELFGNITGLSGERD